MKRCPGCDIEFETLLYGLCIPCYTEKKSMIERHVRVRAKAKGGRKRSKSTRSPHHNSKRDGM